MKIRAVTNLFQEVKHSWLTQLLPSFVHVPPSWWTPPPWTSDSWTTTDFSLGFHQVLSLVYPKCQLANSGWFWGGHSAWLPATSRMLQAKVMFLLSLPQDQMVGLLGMSCTVLFIQQNRKVVAATYHWRLSCSHTFNSSFLVMERETLSPVPLFLLLHCFVHSTFQALLACRHARLLKKLSVPHGRA